MGTISKLKYSIGGLALFLTLQAAVPYFFNKPKNNQNQAQAAEFSSISLDPRLGVTIANSFYPNRGAKTLSAIYKDMKSLGFKNFEIYLNFEVCNTSKIRPQGFYNTLRFCTPNRTMISMAQDPLYQEILSQDYNTLFINTSNPVQSPHSLQTYNLKSNIAESRFEVLYKEYYDFTKFLLQNYNSPKKIVFNSANEMDWQLGKNVRDINRQGNDQTDLGHQNAIRYWNVIQAAIDNAKKDFPSQLKVYQGCEFTLGRKAAMGGRSVVNNVLPSTHCDLYQYSSYDTTTSNYGGNPKEFNRIVSYIKTKIKPSPDFGRNNLMISEIGYPEMKGDYSAEIKQSIDNALNIQKMPYVMYWQSYSNVCFRINPKNSDCRGYWLRKPDGQLSKVYKDVFLKYSNNPRFVPTDSAEFVKTNIQPNLSKSSTYDVTVSYKNTGNQAWTKTADYKLGSSSPNDNFNWGISRVNLDDDDYILPGEIKDFHFKIKTPAQARSLRFQFKMVKEFKYWLNSAMAVRSINILR